MKEYDDYSAASDVYKRQILNYFPHLTQVDPSLKWS